MSGSLFIIQIPRAVELDERHALNSSAADLSSMNNEGKMEFAAEAELREMLHARQFQNVGWYPTEGGKQIMAIFQTPSDAAEPLLNALAKFGYGSNFGTISLLPVQLAKAAEPARSAATGGKFKAQLRSRLIVEQVVEQTRAGAIFSFDYMMLCVVASILAGVGLATNNTVVIVASMLVSPLMGPILAVTFGTVIRDRPLVSMGLSSEFAGLIICVVVGFVMGMVGAPLGPQDFKPGFPWPNNEMESRGLVTGLYSGLAIAIPSGVGVALSVLGNNTSSLVGVAISASLLPPAVNAGMCWAYAIFGNLLNAGTPVDGPRFLQLGAFSFALTILNIACIYVVALLMFKVKAVAPIPGKTDFWKHDIQNANRYREAVKRGDQPDLAERYKHMAVMIRQQQEMAAAMAGGIGGGGDTPASAKANGGGGDFAFDSSDEGNGGGDNLTGRHHTIGSSSRALQRPAGIKRGASIGVLPLHHTLSSHHLALAGGGGGGGGGGGVSLAHYMSFRGIRGGTRATPTAASVFSPLGSGGTGTPAAGPDPSLGPAANALLSMFDDPALNPAPAVAIPAAATAAGGGEEGEGQELPLVSRSTSRHMRVSTMPDLSPAAASASSAAAATAAAGDGETKQPVGSNMA